MIANLPSWVDVKFLHDMSGLLVVAAVLLVLVLIFVIRSIAARVISILLVGAAVFGLVHYRQTLDNCNKHGCACKFFGEAVPGDNCSTEVNRGV